MNPTRLSLLLAATLALALTSSAGADTRRIFMTLAAGPVGGVYLPVAEALCAAANRALASQTNYCSPEPTPGSAYNLESLLRGEAEFAIVQADTHYLAFRGEEDWAGREAADLRSVLSLHAETITLLARSDAGIAGVNDLRGKRVNIGAQGSGTRASWGLFELAMGFEPEDFAQISELRADQAASLLCSGELDASFLVVGHPSASIAAQIAECDLVLVPVTGPEVTALIAAKPYYVATTIPARTYGLPADVASFGGRATLVTTAATPPADVAAFAKAIISQVRTLAEEQPNLADLTAEAMVRDSLTAPLHPGALQAYRDLGLVAE